MKKITVAYYAKLREERGCSEEIIEGDLSTVAALYGQLREQHGLSLGEHQLRVVINEEFADWNTPLQGGETVVFIPPVAGG